MHEAPIYQKNRVRLWWHAATLATFALLLAACEGNRSQDFYTLRVEITSSGRPLPFRGTLLPHNGSRVPLVGTTPFSLEMEDTRVHCPADPNVPLCFEFAEATVMKNSGAGDVLTVCLSNNDGDRQCKPTAAGSNTVSVSLLVI